VLPRCGKDSVPLLAAWPLKSHYLILVDAAALAAPPNLTDTRRETPGSCTPPRPSPRRGWAGI
jgi:hypothetical protein